MRRIFFLLICLIVLIGAGWFAFAAFIRAPIAGSPVVLEVSAGMTLPQIAEHLAAKKIIGSAWEYRAYAVVSRTARNFKPGSYNLRPNMNDRQIARLLASGQTHQESELRLIEGWTIADEMQYLQEEKHVSPGAVATIAGGAKNGMAFDPALRDEFSFLRDVPSGRSLEGYLFPETYRVWDDRLPDDLIRKQLQEFQNRTAGAVVTKKIAPLSTLDDVIILASIVEKEVRDPADRKIVAGIFLHRMRLGMALQSDATLNFVLDEKRAQTSAEDLKNESKYNSYKYKGLPPSPICNPGASAIDAVLNPTASRYLYFLTKTDGKVLYAATFEEHKRNRAAAGY